MKPTDQVQLTVTHAQLHVLIGAMQVALAAINPRVSEPDMVEALDHFVVTLSRDSHDSVASLLDVINAAHDTVCDGSRRPAYDPATVQ